MFDAVLHPAHISAKRWSASALWAIGVHAALIATAIGVAQRSPPKLRAAREVTFVKWAGQAEPPPPPPAPAAAKKPRTHVSNPTRTVMPATVIPNPLEDDPAEAQDDEKGVAGGVAGGQANGAVGGVLGGTGTRLDFDADSMVRPEMISGPEIEYTPQAIEHEIEGLIRVRCTLLTDGTVHDCKVLKSLPFLDHEVVATLEARRYKPVMLQGQPVEVSYLFNIQMKLP